MYILGLTGSIGMGKTTAARSFRRLGVPVYDSDATVHRLMNGDRETVAAVAAAFPAAVRGGRIDRARLAVEVFDDDAALDRLEGLLHPRVRRCQEAFLRRAARHGYRLVVLDVPLLFEIGGDVLCDATVVVSAPAFLQAQRVLRRPGMTPGRLASIRRRQLPDAVKRARADYVVPTGLGRHVSFRAIRDIVASLADRRGDRWPPSRRLRRRYQASRGRGPMRCEGG